MVREQNRNTTGRSAYRIIRDSLDLIFIGLLFAFGSSKPGSPISASDEPLLFDNDANDAFIDVEGSELFATRCRSIYAKPGKAVLI